MVRLLTWGNTRPPARQGAKPTVHWVQRQGNRSGSNGGGFNSTVLPIQDRKPDKGGNGCGFNSAAACKPPSSTSNSDMSTSAMPTFSAAGNSDAGHEGLFMGLFPFKDMGRPGAPAKAAERCLAKDRAGTRFIAWKR
jgi:hypothetical protein